MTLAALIAGLTTAIGISAIVVSTRLRRGPLLSPFPLSMAVLVSVFGVRPLLEIRLGEHQFYGHDVTDGVPGATVVGLIATVVCIIGYVTAPRRPRVQPPTGNAPASLVPAALVAAGLLAMWLLAMVYFGGGFHFIAVLFSGRNAATRRAIAGVPGIVSTLPTAAAMLVAVNRIRIERVRKLTRDERLAFAIVVFASLVPPMALGTRRYLLPALIAAGVAAMLPTFDKRVPAKAAAVTFVAFVVLISIPYARSTGAQGTGSSTTIGAVGEYLGNDGLGGAVQKYFLSYDTEMFGYISYLDLHLGNEVPYGFGKWLVVDPILAPLPVSVADHVGIRSRSNDVLQQVVGHGCDVSRTCPIPSLPGIGYSEFGLLGVVMLMAVWGRWCNGAARALISARGHRLSAVVVFIGFAPVLIRGNTVNLAWVASNVLILVVAADLVSVRRAARLGLSPDAPRRAPARRADAWVSR